MTDTDGNKTALQNLDQDVRNTIDKFDVLVDELAEPLKHALEQAANRPANCNYDEKQLEEIYNKVMSQMDALEKAVDEKF